jgi:Cupin-like domain
MKHGSYFAIQRGSRLTHKGGRNTVKMRNARGFEVAAIALLSCLACAVAEEGVSSPKETKRKIDKKNTFFPSKSGVWAAPERPWFAPTVLEPTAARVEGIPLSEEGNASEKLVDDAANDDNGYFPDLGQLARGENPVLLRGTAAARWQSVREFCSTPSSSYSSKDEKSRSAESEAEIGAKIETDGESSSQRADFADLEDLLPGELNGVYAKPLRGTPDDQMFAYWHGEKPLSGVVSKRDDPQRTWFYQILSKVPRRVVVEGLRGNSINKHVYYLSSIVAEHLPHMYSAFGRSEGQANDTYHRFVPQWDDMGVPDEFSAAVDESVRKLPHDAQLWLGPEGVLTPTHSDAYHNVFVQVCGAKRFYLWPPEQSWSLYTFPDTHPRHQQARVDIRQAGTDAPEEDLLDEFPRFANISGGLSVTVEAGDVLYIPPQWFHAVYSLTPSASLTTWTADASLRAFQSLVKDPVNEGALVAETPSLAEMYQQVALLILELVRSVRGTSAGDALGFVRERVFEAKFANMRHARKVEPVRMRVDCDAFSLEPSACPSSLARVAPFVRDAYMPLFAALAKAPQGQSLVAIQLGSVVESFGLWGALDTGVYDFFEKLTSCSEAARIVACVDSEG